MSKRVVSVLTGNVDSAVASLLLKRNGYRVTGAYIHNDLLPPEVNDKHLELAARSASILNINFREITLHKDHWHKFKRSALKEYNEGYNPDLAFRYTRDITFGAAVDHILHHLGAEAVATEHIARTSVGPDVCVVSKTPVIKLQKGLDQLYDDSSLLAGISQLSLTHLLLPLGDMAKEIIPIVAESVGLKSFIPEKGLSTKDLQHHLHTLLLQELPAVTGKFINKETFKEVGSFDNFHSWKAGDSLNINGQDYVIVEKDLKTKQITVANSQQHPALYCETFFTGLAHWLSLVHYNFYKREMMDVELKNGHDKPVIKGTLTVGTTNEYCGNDHIIVSCSCPVISVTPGHFSVFYHGEDVLGCSRIFRRGPSLYAMNYKNYKQDTPASPTSSSIIKNLFNNLKKI